MATPAEFMASLEALAEHEGWINKLLGVVGLLKGGPAGAAAAYGVAKGIQTYAAAAQARRALQRAQEAVSGAPMGAGADCRASGSCGASAGPAEQPGALGRTGRCLLRRAGL